MVGLPEIMGIITKSPFFAADNASKSYDCASWANTKSAIPVLCALHKTVFIVLSSPNSHAKKIA